MLDAPYAADKADLLATVATGLPCVSVRRTHRRPAYDGGRELSIHLFGHASDLERSELLFTSLLLQSAQGLARTPVPARDHKAACRRTWPAGFRMAVGRRTLSGSGSAEGGPPASAPTSAVPRSTLVADSAPAPGPDTTKARPPRG